MAALTLDLSVEQGSTWAHGFLPQINGENLLGEGWTAQAQARATKADETVLHEWSTALGNLGIDAVAGAVVMTLAPADSSAWDWRVAVYDLEVTSPDGEMTFRVAQGRIRVSAEVTR